MAYTKVNWAAGVTVLNEANMDHLETQYDEADGELTTHEALDTGTHGAGGDTLATDADIATHAALETVHGSIHVGKSTTETVNNSIALQDDDDLQFAIGSNENWELFLCLKFSVANATSEGIDVAFSVPAAGNIVRLPDAFETNQTGDDATAEEQIVAGVVTNMFRMTRYLYIAGGNAGDIKLQWAQHVAHASNCDMLEGSCLIAHRIG